MTRFIVLLTLVALLATTSMAFAATGADIEIYDEDSPTQDPVIGAVVTLVGGSNYQQTTDANGMVYFNVPAGTYDVYVDGDLKTQIVVQPYARLANRVGTALS